MSSSRRRFASRPGQHLDPSSPDLDPPQGNISILLSTCPDPPGDMSSTDRSVSIPSRRYLDRQSPPIHPPKVTSRSGDRPIPITPRQHLGRRSVDPDHPKAIRRSLHRHASIPASTSRSADRCISIPPRLSLEPHRHVSMPHPHGRDPAFAPQRKLPSLTGCAPRWSFCAHCFRRPINRASGHETLAQIVRFVHHALAVVVSARKTPAT
jgi:hypothetical protein